VHLHGLAGDRAADALGEESLMASDILAHLPGAFRELIDRAARRCEPRR
jgi:NAD(P)H-hydrate epimerase